MTKGRENSRCEGKDRWKCVLPLHPLLVSGVLKHTLWGHVSHQRHGGIGISLVPGGREERGCALSGDANPGPSQTVTGQAGQRAACSWGLQ